MREQKKIIILSISILLLFFLGFLLSNYSHELGHKKVADKYGISGNIIILNLKHINFPYTTIASFNFNKENCIKINNLPFDKKSEFFLEGIKNELSLTKIFLLLYFIIFVFLIIIYLKNKNPKLLIFLILFTLLIILSLLNLYSISTNLEYLPQHDFYNIFNNLSC